jgi:hypothetical protein
MGRLLTVLAAGCQLTDDSGNVGLDSPACRRAFGATLSRQGK